MKLMLQGHSTGNVLKGRKLTDQYSNGQRYILITTDDEPQEESLYIYLMDLEMNVIDELGLSQPFAAGTYRACHHEGERLEFCFFDDGLWRLQVRHRPKSQPLNFDHFPVQRPVKLWGQQYLSLEKLRSNVA